MKIRITAYGIARDILNGSSHEFSLEVKSVGDLKDRMISDYPAFGELRSLRFAVNEDYCEDDYILSENDEVVIIPPVSGG